MYTTTKLVEQDGVTDEDLSVRHQKPQNRFLFVGNINADINEYHSFFEGSLRSNSFAEAKMLLKQVAILPELIIIDIPLTHIELVAFKVWLRTNQLNNIPVIYNEAALKPEEIKQLFSQKLVDDVVKLENNYKRLPYKAKFIQKLNDTNSAKKQAKKVRIAPAKSRFGFIQSFADRTLALCAIIICFPIFVVIAVAIKLESRGPVFYSAKRAGKGFRIFKFYKFRTMIVDADKQIEELSGQNLYTVQEKSPAFFKIENDPRITRIGSFLRNSSLDELPQLFNVLKGDMSIVGNRPLPLYEASTLTTDEWAERFMAPAGITGLWQISKRGKQEMSTEERILLDINYARSRSIRGDLMIILQTPTALIQKANV
jgi:lipopolysaccharide/colanic/teichoic acid biosynthesis glycosyltransferase